MNQNKIFQEGEGRVKMTYRQRWRREDDGTYWYIGACPFNNGVCKLMNLFATMKQEG
jgi:hypothetical protein